MWQTKKSDNVPNNGGLQHTSLKNNTHNHNMKIKNHQTNMKNNTLSTGVKP